MSWVLFVPNTITMTIKITIQASTLTDDNHYRYHSFWKQAFFCAHLFLKKNMVVFINCSAFQMTFHSSWHHQVTALWSSLFRLENKLRVLTLHLSDGDTHPPPVTHSAHLRWLNSACIGSIALKRSKYIQYYVKTPDLSSIQINTVRFGT